MVGGTEISVLPFFTVETAKHSRTCPFEFQRLFSGAPAPRISDPTDPETKNPAPAGTGSEEIFYSSKQVSTKAPRIRQRKSVCIHGHDFSLPNTYWHGGRRNCRSCNRMCAARYRARRKGVAQ
jgi:hypothetical protein